jgi:hypothetical protein
LGNTADDFVGSISVTIESNPVGGTLTGTATMTAVAGVVTFTTLSLDKVGIGYTLSATSTTLTAASSAAFDVIPGAASRLSITVQPGNATAAEAIAPAIEVTALDGLGNVATGFTDNVALAIGANPGGGTLFGNATVQADEVSPGSRASASTRPEPATRWQPRPRASRARAPRRSMWPSGPRPSSPSQSDPRRLSPARASRPQSRSPPKMPAGTP